MMKKELVLLFDGIGEVINESILEKEPETSLMYQAKLEEYASFIQKELKPYEDVYGHEETICDWIHKFIYDCCMYLKNEPYMQVKYILPYSMGLITAITCMRGISFEDGIRIIIRAYFYSKELKQDEMRMLMVVGYEREELYTLMRKECEPETLFEAADLGCNYILLSGLKKSMDKLKPLLIEGGALKLNEIATPVAYHTHMAKENIQSFADVVNRVSIHDIEIPVCSLYSNAYIQTAEELRKELIINLYTKMNVTNGIKKIKNDGYTIFYEIGATKSLYKIYRRMDDEIKIIRNLNY